MIDFVDKIIPGYGSFDHPDYTGYFETLLCNTINLITLKYCAIQKKLYKYTYDFKWLLNILSLKCFEINLKINFIFNLKNLNLCINCVLSILYCFLNEFSSKEHYLLQIHNSIKIWQLTF